MAKKIKCIVKRPEEKVGHIVHTSCEPIDLRRFIGEPIKVIRLDDKTILLSQGDRLSYAHCGFIDNKRIADCIDNNNVIICGGEYGNFSDILITKKEWLAMLTDIKDRAAREMEWKKSKESRVNKINFKGTEYLVSGIAYTINEGEYYIAKRSDDDRNILIPTDSIHVTILD